MTRRARSSLADIQLYGMNANGDLLARGPNGPWFVEENGARTELPTMFLPSFYPTTLFTNGTVAGYSYDDTTFETAVVWQRA